MTSRLNKLGLFGRKILLVDGIGALVSAFFLGVVLYRLEATFGMPCPALRTLTVPACFFACYSLLSFLFAGENWRSFLRLIIIANVLYACLSVWLVIGHYAELSVLGLAYFCLELLVLAVLVFAEVKVLSEKGAAAVGGH